MELVNYVAVDDVGTVMNPLLLHGQIDGHRYLGPNLALFPRDGLTLDHGGVASYIVNGNPLNNRTLFREIGQLEGLSESRVCSRCGETKPAEDFPLRKKGRPQRHSYCRACKAVMQKNWYQRNKARHLENVKAHKRLQIARNRALINEIKSAPCTDCGKRYPPPVMDLDHVRGQKVDDISRLVVRPVSARILLEEVAKCDLVCVNCHRDRTFRRLQREAAGNG